MTRRCPRCGRRLAARDQASLQHAANVRKLIAWWVLFPFTAGAAVAAGVAIGLGSVR